MPTEIKDKFSTSAALTVTLASLATSATGVGRQGTLVDNTTNRFTRAVIYYKITQGTSPTGSKAAYFYLIRSDNDATTQHNDAAGGASDGAWTALPNVQPVHIAYNLASPSTGEVLQGSFVVEDLGPEWTIGVYHDTGVDLDSTGGNHWIRYVGINPESQ